MIKYLLAAAALKALSSTEISRKFYRNVIGNYIGQKKRFSEGITPFYIKRAGIFLHVCRKYNAVQDGMHLLEIGTGWIHFYAIFIRLFYDVKITLVDVWDNRQFHALKKTFGNLAKIIDASFTLNKEESNRAHNFLEIIATTKSFDELYHILNFDYVIASESSLSFFKKSSFDLIFSFHVLEHVHKNEFPFYIKSMAEILKSGGFLVHQIGIDDHLAHYDTSVSPKNYLKYSNLAWKTFFENRLQYFNRIQPSEWKKMFEDSGIKLLEENVESCSTQNIKVHKEFSGLNLKDSACTELMLVLSKTKCNPLNKQYPFKFNSV